MMLFYLGDTEEQTIIRVLNFFFNDLSCPSLPPLPFPYFFLTSIYNMLSTGITILNKIDMVPANKMVKKKMMKGIRRDQIFLESKVLYLFS